MAARNRQKVFRGRVRPLDTRIEETKDKLERLELQAKIKELKAKFGRKRR